jgi:hypothetical protein
METTQMKLTDDGGMIGPKLGLEDSPKAALIWLMKFRHGHHPCCAQVEEACL